MIGGCTPPKGSRERFGALLVGYNEGADLRYAGKVGTGFDHATLELLGDKMERREREKSAVHRLGSAARPAGPSPSWSASSASAQWTRDGKLRHPRYLGLRDDKAQAK